METGTPETTTDIEWCYEAVHDVSRTFSITVKQLERPISTHICVGYLLCRIADTIEDAGRIPSAEKPALLTKYDQLLDPEKTVTADSFLSSVQPWIPDESNADWSVVTETPRVIGVFETLEAEPREQMRAPIRELVQGMATFTQRYADHSGLRIQTLDELEEYCWYAAGTVGVLVTELVARDASPERTETLRENARSFALLLQLVNIAKDVTSDYRDENNIYLPAEWLSGEQLEPETMLCEERESELVSVVERVTDRAATYLDDAQRYLEALPEHRGNTLSAWAIPYLLAVGTIRELRTRPEDVIRKGDVKVSRDEVYALIQRFNDGLAREEIAPLRSKMEAQPLHR